MGNNIFTRAFLFFFLAGSLIAGAFAADAVLDEAKRLMAENNPKAAYELLVPLQSERAGDPEYDYLLGLAAMDHGKPGEAVFALERVLAVNPNHVQARAEIARAYLALGEREAAKQEFETVQKLGAPAEAAPTIQKFLDTIEQLSAADRTQVRRYVEVTMGYDSNVNSATSSGQVAVPLFGGAIFTLANTAVEQDDEFFSAGAGVSVRHPLSPVLALFAGANVNKRINGSQDTFDTGLFDLNAGVARTHGKDVYTLGFQGSNFYVDNERFRDAYGLSAQWQRNYDARNQATAYLQYSDLHYPGQDIRDAKRYVLGGAFAHAYQHLLQPTVYAGAYVGTEDEEESNVPHLGHDLWGMRLGGQLRYSERVKVFVNTSFEKRDYDGADPFFLKTRDDEQWDLRIGADYVPLKHWRITPQVSYTDNDSNLKIHEFKRDVWSVTVRREF